MSKRSLDKKFAGSMVLLQEKMRQDPESYQEEYQQHLAHFESVVDILKCTPTAVPEKSTAELIQIVTGVCNKIHGDAAERLTKHITMLLSPPCVASLAPTIARSLLQGLMLLRSRGLVASEKTLPLFLQLLAMRDKETRKMLLWHISSDICKANVKTRLHAENRRLQALMNGIVQEDDGARSRYVLSLMIDLYRRKVWKDDLTVHFISTAVFLRNTHTVKTTLRFLLSRTYTLGADDSDSDDPGKQIMSLKRSFRVRKKNKNRENKLKKGVHALAKGYQEDIDEKETKLQAEHDPILLIRDPQEYAEKLFKQLQKTSEKFEVRLLSMQVLARLVSTHQLILLNFYPYLERYMEPYQRDVSSILAVAVQCVHHLVPPEALTPLLKTVANHFVNDKASPDAITVGLNTIREMCKRQPLIMDTTLLHDLIQYTSYRENKGVVMAARSLLRYFRIMQPDMLPNRERGRGHDMTKKLETFGGSRAVEGIPGFDLLVQHEQAGNLAGAEDQGGEEDDDDDFEAEPGSDDDDDDDDDEWEVQEDGEEEADDDDDDDESEGSDAPDLIAAVPMDRLSTGANTGAQASISTLADRFLTADDFALMEKLKTKELTGGIKGSKKMLAGKRLRLATETDITDVVDPTSLELHTSKKLKRDKEARVEKVQEERKRHSVGAKKNQKKGGRHATNGDKRKTKLFQMSQRSRTVGAKLGLSQAQQNERIVDQKKKNVKFRIKRGYGC